MENLEVRTKKRKRNSGQSVNTAPTTEVLPTRSLVAESGESGSKAVKQEKRKRKRKTDNNEEDDVAAPAVNEFTTEEVTEEPQLEDSNEDYVSAQENATDDNDVDTTGVELRGINDLPTTNISLPPVGSDPTKFSELNLSSKTMQAIEDMKFETMTEIQQRGIPPLLAG